MNLIPTNIFNKITTLLTEDDLHWTVKSRETYIMYVYESPETTDIKIIITKDDEKIVTTIEDKETSSTYDIIESLTEDELKIFEIILDSVKNIKELEEEKEAIDKEIAEYESNLSKSNVVNLREVVKDA